MKKMILLIILLSFLFFCISCSINDVNKVSKFNISYIIDDKETSFEDDDRLKNVISKSIEDTFYIRNITKQNAVYIITVEDMTKKQYDIYSLNNKKKFRNQQIKIGKKYHLLLIPYFKHDYKYDMKVSTYRQINIGKKRFYTNKTNIYFSPHLNGRRYNNIK